MRCYIEYSKTTEFYSGPGLYSKFSLKCDACSNQVSISSVTAKGFGNRCSQLFHFVSKVLMINYIILHVGKNDCVKVKN